ncbi:plasma membrane-associated cation-binding protein 1-like [Capsicum annuum]|nr:plasma membrane-associated cation-binding protein 1-like [Capsicum annuum]
MGLASFVVSLLSLNSTQKRSKIGEVENEQTWLVDGENFTIDVGQALRGVKVEVTHKGNIRRRYRISGLTSQPTRELIFLVDEEKNMKSVIEYFQEVYGFTIQYLHLPCVLVGSQKKVNYLSIEVKTQSYFKIQLSFISSAKFLQIMIVVIGLYDTRGIDIHQKVGREADNFTVKIIVPKTAETRNGHFAGKEKKYHPQLGQWNMINKEFNCEPVIPIYYARPDQAKKALNYVYNAAASKLRGKELELLIAILPDNNGSLYGKDCSPSIAAVSRICEDGISDGQFYQVQIYELDAIRKACASLEPGYQPPIIFIVVKKRHHIRLLPNNHNDRNHTDRSGNILPCVQNEERDEESDEDIDLT